MSRNLKAAFGLAAVAWLVGGPAQAQQDERVHILQSRPYTSADTTGLVHAPERLLEVRSAGARDPQNCAQHLRDAALNVDLLLITSFSSSSVRTSGDTVFTYRTTYGDYAPKTRRVYGLSNGELVRVDCSRDRPVGRVRARTENQLDRR